MSYAGTELTAQRDLRFVQQTSRPSEPGVEIGIGDPSSTVPVEAVAVINSLIFASSTVRGRPGRGSSSKSVTSSVDRPVPPSPHRRSVELEPLRYS
ncbi:hypothetical protein AZG88_39550 [Rhodococcus sp. LB1]|nr:hypothetical protein AZG88_39550 [Rhodococcus sp. LB1]